jgi:hypothetical protein
MKYLLLATFALNITLTLTGFVNFHQTQNEIKEFHSLKQSASIKNLSNVFISINFKEIYTNSNGEVIGVAIVDDMIKFFSYNTANWLNKGFRFTKIPDSYIKHMRVLNNDYIFVFDKSQKILTIFKDLELALITSLQVSDPSIASCGKYVYINDKVTQKMYSFDFDNHRLYSHQYNMPFGYIQNIEYGKVSFVDRMINGDRMVVSGYTCDNLGNPKKLFSLDTEAGEVTALGNAIYVANKNRIIKYL